MRLDRFDSSSRVSISYTHGRNPAYVVDNTFETGGGVWLELREAAKVSKESQDFLPVDGSFYGPVGANSDWSAVSMADTAWLYQLHPGIDKKFSTVFLDLEFWLWSPGNIFSTETPVQIEVPIGEAVEAVGGFVIDKVQVLTGSVYFRGVTRAFLRKLRTAWKTRIFIACTETGTFYGYQRCTITAGTVMERVEPQALPEEPDITWEVLSSLSSLFEEMK